MPETGVSGQTLITDLFSKNGIHSFSKMVKSDFKKRMFRICWDLPKEGELTPVDNGGWIGCFEYINETPTYMPYVCDDYCLARD